MAVIHSGMEGDRSGGNRITTITVFKVIILLIQRKEIFRSF